MTNSNQSSIQVAKNYFGAINESRLDDLANVFAEDATLSFPMLNPMRGRMAIRDFYAGIMNSYPERYDKVTRWFVSDDADVAAEIHFEGRTTTGRSVIFDAVDLFRISDGQIHELLIFYDSARVLKMIGEVPQ